MPDNYSPKTNRVKIHTTRQHIHLSAPDKTRKALAALHKGRVKKTTYNTKIAVLERTAEEQQMWMLGVGWGKGIKAFLGIKENVLLNSNNRVMIVSLLIPKSV